MRYSWVVVVLTTLLALRSSAPVLVSAGSVCSHCYTADVIPAPGQFLTTLWIGTPPVAFTAILDTGSDLVWRQCETNNATGTTASQRANRPFFPSRSSTYTTATCQDSLCSTAGGTCDRRRCRYNQSYVDPPAYTSGELSYDTLTWYDRRRSRRVSRFAFGCSYQSFGPYNFAGSSGIVGLGQSPLSLPAQLHVSTFSYCLTRSNSPSAFLLGPVFTRSAPKYSYKFTMGYYINLIGIFVNGDRLNIPSKNLQDGGTLVDSGTTFSTLPASAFHALVSTIKSHIGRSLPRVPSGTRLPRNLSLCYTHSGPVPSLAFHFSGSPPLLLPSSNYFILIDGFFCLAMLPSNDGQAVFGNTQQENFHVTYDIHAQTISFQPTNNCTLVR